MSLYRIAYASGSQAHSVVRELPLRPVPGDQITLDARTIVSVREVVLHPKGDTIEAEVVAEMVPAAVESAPLPGVTGSSSHSSS